MIKFKKNKQIFKRNYPFYFIFLLLTVINLLYVRAEVNRPNILKSMGYNFIESSVFQVSQTEVEKLATVHNYSLLFESAFLVISLLCILLLFTKKVRPLFKSLLIMTFIFFLCLFILNITLATIFGAPPGNLTQLLLIPFQFLFLSGIYGFVKFRN